MITPAQAAATIRALATIIRESHTYRDVWDFDDPADKVAKDQHDAALAIADELDAQARMCDTSNDTPPRVILDANHAQARRALSELCGAASATLHAIHKAGGHVIADPHHQTPIEASLRALEIATRAALVIDAMKETE